MNSIYRSVWNEITRTFVAAAETVRGRGKASSGVCTDGAMTPASRSGAALARRRPMILALEQRFMFDGAAAAPVAEAAAAAVAADAHVAIADAVANAPAPVEVRAADPAKDDGKKEVVFVDTTVANYKTLEAGIRDGVAIVEIDGAKDGLAQIAKWAQTNSGYDSIAILGHGAQATLYLGTTTLTTASLASANVQTELAEIGRSLTADGDLMLYGCDVAAGSKGEAFIAALAEATGADVAASDDATGNAAQEGDWVLEKASGGIEVRTLDISGYAGILELVSFTDSDTLDLSFTRTINGQTVTFSTPSMYWMNVDGGLSAYDHDEGGISLYQLSISITPGYSFDISSFQAIATSGKLTASLTYADGRTVSFDITTSTTTLSQSGSFSYPIDDVTRVILSSTDYSSLQGFEILDVKSGPTVTTPALISLIDTSAADTFSNRTGTLTVTPSSVSHSAIASYGISGGSTGGSTNIGDTVYDVSKVGTYGTLYVNSSTGAYVYDPADTAINAAVSNQNETFSVSATDISSVTGSATLTVSIAGANDTPTDLSLSANTLNQSAGTNATVGTLSSVDAESGQPHTYSLVSGTGDTNNASFNISGSTLRANNASTLAAGTYSVRVQTSDGAGSYAEVFSITVADNVAPAAPTALDLATASDSGSSDTDNITSNTTPTITGTAEAGSTVTLYDTDGSTVLGTATATGGVWSITCNALSAGIHTLTAKSNDAAGNVSAASAGLGITIDVAAPSTTVSTAIFSADTGSSNSDFITKTASQTVSGTLAANLVSGESVYVSLDHGSTWMAATTTVGSSAWSLAGQTLSASSTLQVKVSDAAGNDGAVYSQAYVLDTTAPTTTVSSAALSNDTGSSTTDFITKASSQTVSGSLSANLASGETVYVSLDNGATWSAAAASVGQNTWSLDGQTLAASSTLRVKVTDSAGNDGAVLSQAYVYDATAPATTFSTIRFSADSGASSSDLITRTAAQTITATLSGALAGGDVVYGSLDNGSSWADVTSKVSGTTMSWNGVTLAGSNTLLLRVVDAAGNIGASSGQAYTLDTSAPATPATPVLASASDSGASASDRITSDTSPTLSGTAETGSTVTLYDGATLLGSVTASGGVWTYTTATLSGGEHTFTAVSTDTAGNASAASAGLLVTIDTTAPSVTTVSVPASGTYYTGEAIDFTVNFAEAVIVDASGGTPRIAMVVGATTRYADYLSGSGSSALTFRYTVVSGDTDANGITVGALSPNGGTLKDAAGNDAVTTLNSVGSTAGVNVDGSNPSVTNVDATNANGAYGAGQTITLTVDFSSAVTVDTSGGTPTLALASGGSATYSGGSGTSTLTFSYTVGAGQNSADLDYSSTSALSLNGATIVDAGGAHQAAALTLATPGTAGSLGANQAIVIDTAAPTATIVMSDSSLAIGETAQVIITFSEAVSGFDNSDLSVANGTLSAVSSNDGGISWSATFTPTANVSDTSNVITLANAGVTDAAGNAGVGVTTSNNYAIDSARPSATIVVADSVLAAGETSLVTITFSEAVSGFTNADLTIANGTLSAVSSSDGGVTWTATFTPAAGVTDSSNVITLGSSGVVDLAGNMGSGTTDSNNYAVDGVRPTATIVVADSALMAGETSLVTITFSEAVSGFANDDLAVANGTLSAVSSSDGGVTWSATLTPSANVSDTSNLITLDTTGIYDVAGNAGTATADSNNYTVSTVRPTATIAISDTSLTFGETATVTITFSEAVSGFSNADLTVANGTLSAVSSSDGGVTWSATFTPTADVSDASNVITLNDHSVENGVGNANSGAATSANYAVLTARTLAYSATTLVEAAANDGSISSTLTISLANGTFAGADGSALGMVSNVPAGLTAHLVKVDATHAALTLTGNASAHASAQDLNNLTVSFADADFAGGSATTVTGATTLLAIDFVDPVADSAVVSAPVVVPPSFVVAPPQFVPPPATPTPPLLVSPAPAGDTLLFIAPVSPLTLAANPLADSSLASLVAPQLAAVAPAEAARAPEATASAADGSSQTPAMTQGGGFQVVVASGGGASLTGGLVVNRGVADQSVVSGTVSQFAIPADAFAASSVGAVVTLAARQSDGRPLPGWLHFNAASGSFEGQPPPGFTGEVSIRVVARDAQGHEAVTTFKIKVGRPSSGDGQRAQPERSGRAGLAEQIRLTGRPHPALERLARLAGWRNAA